jgi:hypothetical protein
VKLLGAERSRWLPRILFGFQSWLLFETKDRWIGFPLTRTSDVMRTGF